jgi:hypothetical protein
MEHDLADRQTDKSIFSKWIPTFFFFHVTLANANKNHAQIFDNMKKKSSLPTLQNLFTIASFAK